MPSEVDIQLHFDRIQMLKGLLSREWQDCVQIGKKCDMHRARVGGYLAPLAEKREIQRKLEDGRAFYRLNDSADPTP